MIKWEELNDYIGKPVWDDSVKRWRILDGYRRDGDSFYLAFTDIDYLIKKDITELMIYKSEVEKDVSSSD